MRREVTNRDWFGKVCAGVVCGFLLGVGASGLFKYSIGGGRELYWPEGLAPIKIPNLIWPVVVSFCFLFPSTRSAWGWLGLATGLLWGVLLLLGVVA